MDIKMLKHTDYQDGVQLNDSLFLEYTQTTSSYDWIPGVRYDLYHLRENRRYEMLPKMEKVNLGRMDNVSINSPYIYFFHVQSGEQNRGRKSKVEICRYHYEKEEVEHMISLEEELALFPGDKQLHVFVLNDSYLLVQHAYRKMNLSETRDGFFDYEIDLYHMKDGSRYTVIDENLVRNGIHDMIAVSENICVARTGFSLWPDQRYEWLTQEEASLEKLSFVNIGQLVSDMIISKSDIVIDTFEQAFYKNTIPYVKKMGDYIVYSKVDFEKKEEEVTFYNYITKETRNCINQWMQGAVKLAQSCVIQGEPFIYREKDQEVFFLNLNTGRIECSFKQVQSVLNISDRYIILKAKKRKHIFRREQECFEIYSCPGGELLLRSFEQYLGSVITKQDGNDEIYVFIS